MEQTIRPTDVSFCNTVLILDTGVVMSSRNREVSKCLEKGWRGFSYLNIEEIRSEVLAVENAREILRDKLNAVVVPIEVRDEIDNHIKFFRAKSSGLNNYQKSVGPKRNEGYKLEALKLKELRTYISAMENFQNENIGLDPRYSDPRNNLLKRIDTTEKCYQWALEHYSRAVILKHREKNQDPSEADIALATLSYVLWRETFRTPCIITRDGDFKHLALTTSPSAKIRYSNYEKSYLVSVVSKNYSVRIYTSKE